MEDKSPLLSSEIRGAKDNTPSKTKNRLIDADEFIELILSNRRFLRDDGREIGWRALINPETGDRFVVEEHKLHRALTRG